MVHPDPPRYRKLGVRAQSRHGDRSDDLFISASHCAGTAGSGTRCLRSISGAHRKPFDQAGGMGGGRRGDPARAERNSYHPDKFWRGGHATKAALLWLYGYRRVHHFPLHRENVLGIIHVTISIPLSRRSSAR